MILQTLKETEKPFNSEREKTNSNLEDVLHLQGGVHLSDWILFTCSQKFFLTEKILCESQKELLTLGQLLKIKKFFYFCIIWLLKYCGEFYKFKISSHSERNEESSSLIYKSYKGTGFFPFEAQGQNDNIKNPPYFVN